MSNEPQWASLVLHTGATARRASRRPAAVRPPTAWRNTAPYDQWVVAHLALPCWSKMCRTACVSLTPPCPHPGGAVPLPQPPLTPPPRSPQMQYVMKQVDVKDMSDKDRRAADNEVAVLRSLRVCARVSARLCRPSLCARVVITASQHYLLPGELCARWVPVHRDGIRRWR